MARHDSARWMSAFGVIRPYVGWILIMVGIVLEVLGWYGVSGESVVAKQLPYIASASLPGVALFIAGTVLAAAWSGAGGAAGSNGSPTARQVAELHAALIEDDVAASVAVSPSAGPVAVPGGSTYHRPGCPLVTGKPDAAAVGPDEITARGLAPCPVCEPDAAVPGAEVSSRPGAE